MKKKDKVLFAAILSTIGSAVASLAAVAFMKDEETNSNSNSNSNSSENKFESEFENAFSDEEKAG